MVMKTTSDTSFCGKTFILCEPWPCNPAAGTALQILIRCSESLSSHLPSSQEERFFEDAGKSGGHFTRPWPPFRPVRRSTHPQRGGRLEGRRFKARLTLVWSVPDKKKLGESLQFQRYVLPPIQV